MRRALLTLVLLALAGCGSSSPSETPSALPVLLASALPKLQASTESIGADGLAADFGSAVAVKGLEAGTERVFQGESESVDRVVSRTLEFETAAAAKAYVDLLRTHVDDVYGTGTTAEPLESDGRTGYLIDPAACACHRAVPTLTAVLSRGQRVTYLAVNGGGVGPAAVQELLALAP